MSTLLSIGSRAASIRSLRRKAYTRSSNHKANTSSLHLPTSTFPLVARSAPPSPCRPQAEERSYSTSHCSRQKRTSFPNSLSPHWRPSSFSPTRLTSGHVQTSEENECRRTSTGNSESSLRSRKNSVSLETSRTTSLDSQTTTIEITDSTGNCTTSTSINSFSEASPTDNRYRAYFWDVEKQVSVDDRRHLFAETEKLNVEAGMSPIYGSIAYQIKDANMEASGVCEFVFRSLKIISKTVLMTAILVLTTVVPVLMVIFGSWLYNSGNNTLSSACTSLVTDELFGVQYLDDCPLEPSIPVYLLVGGCFGTVKFLWLICQQVRSRRYERIDDAFPDDGLEEIFSSTSYRATDVALSLFLFTWFGFGNYWVYRIYLPNFEFTMQDPNNWCSKTLYLFTLAQLCFVYAILFILVLLAICLGCGQKCVKVFGENYK